MDKYEYKIRAEEIKTLIARGEYVQAVEIADTVDWRRVKSVMMLCTISDLYKINRRFEDARDMLQLAYDRHPGGRTIIYSLCELSIKMEEFVQAVEYYKEFIQIAPKDTGRYILQYKLYEAQDVGLEERIAVLEDLKKRDYREKWAYELAYLYHRIGLSTRCVEECDELILWFGEGKYVIKAMELKMLHQPLTPGQQKKYDNRFAEETVYENAQDYSEEQPEGEEVAYEAAGYENGYGSEGYSDQAAYNGNFSYENTGYEADTYEAEGGYYPDSGMDDGSISGYREENGYETFYEDQGNEADDNAGMEEYGGYTAYGEHGTYSQDSMESAAEPEEELDIQVKTMNVGKFDTINLQKELAEGLKEVLGTSPEDMETEDLDFPLVEEVDENDLEMEEMQESEVFFGETGELEALNSGYEQEEAEEYSADKKSGPEEFAHETKNSADIKKEDFPVKNNIKGPVKQVYDKQDTSRVIMDQMRLEYVEPPKELAQVLSMESDGQLSLVIPEADMIEKQITGQLSIEDILSEWERMKKENEEKRREADRKRVLEHTGSMFTEFEEAVRDGILEKLEEDKELSRAADEQNIIHVENAFITADKDNDAEENHESRYPETIVQDLDSMEFSEIEYGEIQDEYSEAYSGAEDAELSQERMDTDREELSEEYPETEEEEYSEEYLKEEMEELPEEYPETEKEEYSEEYPEEEMEELPEKLPETEKEEYSEEYPEEEMGELPEELPETEKEAYSEEYPEEEMEELPEKLPETEKEEYSEEYPEEEMEELPEELPETEKEAYSEEYPEEEMEELSKGQPESKRKEKDRGQQELSGKEPEKKAVKKENREPSNADPEKNSAAVQQDKAFIRSLTKEERELFGPYIQNKSSRERLVTAIDNISLAAYTGNIIITGDEGMDTMTLAKNMIREVQMNDSNFSGKIAKISGSALNSKQPITILNQLKNGALIIQKAADMDEKTVGELYNGLQQETLGIIVVLEDVKKSMTKFLLNHPDLLKSFTARMDVEALSNETLAAFGRKYARELEYSIDDLGMLALHTRIEDLQTSDHAVTVLDVKEIMDEAIHHASRKTFGHFFDILLAKRYDEEDMIVLREKDFVETRR